MRSSIAVLALIGAVTQSEEVQAVQKKHHHHHHKQSLAQEPKKDDKDADLNPDENRKTFDAAVKLANKVVSTEVRTENTNTTNIAAANAKATAESNKVFTDVTTARVQQTHGEVNHRQWVNKNQTGNWVQTSTPDNARTTYENSVAEAAKVVSTQVASEKSNVTTITDIHAKAADKTTALKNKVVEARETQIAGAVPYSRNSRGWQLVPPGTGHALAQGAVAQTQEKKESASEAPKSTTQKLAQAEPAKEEAKAPAEEAKAPAKEEAKAEAAPAKEEAKPEAKAEAAPAKEEAAPAKAEGDAAKAPAADAKPADAAAEGQAPDAKDAKAPVKAAAPKADEDKVALGTPENSYSEKAASLQVVLDTVTEQRRFENQSNNEVATAQEKYYKKSENDKNTVRVARKIQRDGGLVHDTPMPVKYKLPGFTGKASLAQADPAAPVEEKKEGEPAAAQGPPKQNPENAYKEKAASRKAVEKTVADQQAFESRSNKDVAAAQEKFWDQAENQKNDVRIDRRIQANGGLDHREGYQRWPASSLMQRETPDESRKIFEAHVKEAAAVVKTENSQENTRTTQIAKMDNQNVKDTFNEKARVRSGRVSMMRGGPRQRYSGGHNGPAGQEAKAAALAQESGSDASSESDSDEEEVNAQKHQALQQAIAKKQNKQQAKEESSDSSSDSDSD